MMQDDVFTHEGVKAVQLVHRYVDDRGWNMTRHVWQSPSEDEMNYYIGDLVWPAGEDRKSYFQVREIHQPGEKFYRAGGVLCSTNGAANRIFFLDAVIKHPDGAKKKKKTK